MLMRMYEIREKMMRKFGIVVAATILIFLIGAAGCQKKDNTSVKNFDADRYFSNLKAENFVIKKAKPFDVDAVIAGLPVGWTVEYASSDFDVASGATILTDLAFTAANNSNIGIRVKEISIWGADSTAIVEHLQGKREDQALPIATRIETSSLKLFGLETLMQPLMDASNAMVGGIAKSDPDMSDLDLTMSMDSYEFTMGKIILTDFVLYPSVLELTDFPRVFADADDGLVDEEVTKIWHWFQRAANYNSMFSVDDVAIYDSVFSLTMTQYGQPTQMSGSIGLTGYKALHRGDIGYAITKDMSYYMDIPIPPMDGTKSIPTRSMKTHSTTEQSTFKGIRLAKAMDHLARGVMPDRTDTDFMSLGVWKTENSIAKFNGKKMYSVDSMIFDMSEFHWLVLEIFDIRFDNIKINFAGFASYMEASLSTLSPSEAKALDIYDGLPEIMEKITAVLKKHDMEEPGFDFNFGIRWDSITGDSAFNYGFGIDDFTRFGWSISGIFPDYEAVMDIIPDNYEDIDEEAMEALFSKTIKFKNYTINIKDEGGFDKGFAMAKDFAELAPEDNTRTAFLRLNSAEQLREMAASSLLMAAGAAHKAFPPAVGYLQSISNFIREGGELTLSMTPPNPLGADDLESFDKLIQTDPDLAVEKFGLSVVHKP